MKKKIFTLLTLAMMAIGSAWAGKETYTYSSLTVGTEIQATTSVKMTPGASGGSITTTVQGGITYFRTASSGSTVTNNIPTNNNFIKLVPSADGFIVMPWYNNQTGSKTINVSEAESSSATTATIIYTATSPTTKAVYSFYFPVSANKAYYIWMAGSGGFYYGNFSFATPVTITTSTDGNGSVSGGGTVPYGSDVTLTATGNAGYAFSSWSDSNTDNPRTLTEVTANATYTANFVAAATKSISVVSNNDSYGTAVATSTIVAEGSSTTLTASTTGEGYAFINWTKSSDGSWSDTNAEVAISFDDLTEGETYTANFKKLYTVTYDLGSYKGSSPKVLNNYKDGVFNEKYANASDLYTIPSYAHRYLYREGYFLTGWTDGVNTYTTGQEITLSDDITLAPQWVPTSQNLSCNATEVTVTWNFRFSQILFNGWQGSGNSGYYTKPQEINGETIAIPMIIDATASGAKIDNSSRADNDNAQTNQKTKFTIPAVKGMTVAIADGNVNFSTTTIAGSTAYEGTGTKSITYTYTGDESTIDIVIGESNQYLKTIAVTYPATAVAITPATEYSTYVTTSALDFSEVDGLEAYFATSTTASAVIMTQVTEVPANTPLVLKKVSGSTFYVPMIASASAPAVNLLVAGDGTTVIGGGSNYDYILYSDGLFYRVDPAGALAAGKAYLHLNSAPVDPTRGLNIVFDDATTGIDATIANKETTDSNVYNLKGQRVAQPTKGLYIVNGKKVVVK